MTDEFQPEAFEDRHRQRLLDLIAEKQLERQRGDPEPEAEPEPQRAPADLMAALQESLNKAARRQGPRTAAPAPRARANALSP